MIPAADATERIGRAFGMEATNRTQASDGGGFCAALWRFECAEAIDLQAQPLSDVHILSLCTAGEHRSTYWGDGRLRHQTVTGPGMFNLVVAGERPRAVQDRLVRTLEYLHIYLPHRMLGDVAQEAWPGVSPGDVELIDPGFVADPGLARLGDELIREGSCGDPLSRLRVDALALDVGVQMLRRHSNLAGRVAGGWAGGVGPGDWRLRRAMEALDADLSQDPGLDALAAMVGLSPRHLTTLFRRGAGVAPHQWLLGRRLERARELLAHPGSTVTEVALACGFASAQHFATTFRRRVGLAPGAWRRERLS